jgi:tetratricopeptide (TPR) repeat protein
VLKALAPADDQRQEADKQRQEAERQRTEAFANLRTALNLADGHRNYGDQLRMQAHVAQEGEIQGIQVGTLGAARAWADLARLLHASGKTAEAEKAYRQVVALRTKMAAAIPTWSYLHIGRAQSYLDLGQFFAETGKAREAEENCSEGLRLLGANQPPDTDAGERRRRRSQSARGQRLLGELFTSSDRPREASAAFGQALKLLEAAAAESPPDLVYIGELAWFLSDGPEPRLRHPKRAIELARAALGTPKRDQDRGKPTPLSDPHLFIGWDWVSDPSPIAGRHEIALANTLGAVYYRAGDWKSAAATLEEALQALPENNGAPRFFLGMAYRKLGEKDKAKRRFDEAVRWMDKYRSKSPELIRLRKEAESLWGDG